MKKRSKSITMKNTILVLSLFLFSCNNVVVLSEEEASNLIVKISINVDPYDNQDNEVRVKMFQ